MNKEILETFMGYFVGMFVIVAVLTSLYLISDTRKTMQGFIECPVYVTTTARDRYRTQYVWAKDCTKVVQIIEGQK